MNIKHDYDLIHVNTFGVSARTQLFVEIHSEVELRELFAMPEFKQDPKLFLGGGSNILFTKDFDGIVILNKLYGIEIIEETDTYVMIRAMSGTVWHDVVSFATERNYWGIENLALIPGTVGGTPVQNIGAYGAELKDVLLNVEVYDAENGSKKILQRDECKLGYRDSIFKHEFRGRYFISAVTLQLSKVEKKNINYKVLRNYLDEHAIDVRNPKDVSEAVSAIRRSKLPDPAVIPNAGSFFKNVFIDEDKFLELISIYPEMPHFKEPARPHEDSGAGGGNKIKIPAAWLIEQCGWKGKRVGNVGVHDKQALVLVNYGGGTGREIKKLADDIISSVKSKFGFTLVPEVNVV